jgi:citrate lyase subunit beta / citryl-CoA lyase
MRLRSLLFVPGDSERKFVKAGASGADALILDLEDSVAPSQKLAARQFVAKLLDDPSPRGWSFFVRVNALDTGLALDDLSAVVKAGLAAIMIPKANGAEDLTRFGHYLDALETKAGMPLGSVKMSVVATETAKAMFALGSYAPAHPRLAALTWGAEDLAAAIGATDNKEPDGAWTFPYQLARAMPVRRDRSRSLAHRHNLCRLPRSRWARARVPSLTPRRLPRAPGYPSGPGRNDQPQLYALGS